MLRFEAAVTMDDSNEQLKAPSETPRMRANVELWDAINEYVRSCGGDPDGPGHIYGNTARHQAVAAAHLAVDDIVKAEVARIVRILDRVDGCVSSENGWIQLLVDEALQRIDGDTRRAQLEKCGITSSMLDGEEPRIADSDTCPCCLDSLGDESRVVNGKRVCVGCVGLAKAGITVPGVTTG